jgi:hypothetical protein
MLCALPIVGLRTLNMPARIKTPGMALEYMVPPCFEQAISN